MRSHGACAELERLGKGGRRCCAGRREGESSFGADFGTVDQWMSIQSLGKRVDESAIAETCDKCQRKSKYSNVCAPTILPNSKSTVLPVVVILSLQQVCIQSLFLMSASAPWGDSNLWSLMADKTQQTENKLR